MSFSTEYLKNSLSKISTIVEWKNNFTRLNAENMNTLSNGVLIIRDSLSNFSEDVSAYFKYVENKIDIIGAAGAKGDYVSFLPGQVLTSEQQKCARENMGINVVSELTGPEQVPNGAAVSNFVYEASKGYCILYTDNQTLLPEEKEQARKNIGASAAEIYVKTPEEEEAIPGYELHIDLTADAAATASEITEETNGEIPTCLAVKNYVTSVLDDLDSKLQELL